MENNIKAIFFDIDGTLISFKTHKMLPSTEYTLKQLKQNGIACFIASGRPYYAMPMIDQTLFDGFVTFNGQYCFAGNQLIHKHPLDKQDVRCAVEQVSQGAYDCLFMETDKAYSSSNIPDMHKLEELLGTCFGTMDYTHADSEDIYQLNAYVGLGEEQKVLEHMKHATWTRWSDFFIDVIPDTGGKDVGADKMLKHFNILPEQAAFFGDGGNDISLLRFVGHGVAMGNAAQAVKDEARYVCEDCESDGIYQQCVRFGLIEPM